MGASLRASGTVKRGDLPTDPALITTEEVGKWFGQRQGSRLPLEGCTRLAEFLNRGPSAEWLALEQRSNRVAQEPNITIDYWDFKEISRAFATLTNALPRIKKHWNDVSDCELAFGARSALMGLDVALSLAGPAINFPFGEYRKITTHPLREWQSASLVIFLKIRELMSDIKAGGVSCSENSVAVRVVQTALRRLGYGEHQTAKIADYLSRWTKRYESDGQTRS